MNERIALRKRRLLLLNTIAKASDEISRIDRRLNHMLDGLDPDNPVSRP
jgi:hypothetical protein